MGRLLVMKRQGIGGVIKYGYLVVARVVKWEYVPEGPHSKWAEGSGVLNVELADIDHMWLSTESKFTVELQAGDHKLVWREVEMVSEECFVAPGHPTQTAA